MLCCRRTKTNKVPATPPKFETRDMASTSTCDLAHSAATLPPPNTLTERPDVAPWSQKNLSRKLQEKLKGSVPPWYMPSQWAPCIVEVVRSQSGDSVVCSNQSSWLKHIFASQFPSKCERYLLYEDDLKGQGFGYSLDFLVAALLLAMNERRVLLEVPLNASWFPLGGGGVNTTDGLRWKGNITYSRTGHHRPATRPRWCSVPPYTLQCYYAPWSHCPIPNVSTHVPPSLHASWARVIRNWPCAYAGCERTPVVRVKLSWIYASWYLWQGKVSRAANDARRFLLRPRQWVRESANCVLKPAMQNASRTLHIHRPGNGDHAGTSRGERLSYSPPLNTDGIFHYVSVHIRDSKEKREELRQHGHALPPLTAFHDLAAIATAALKVRTVLLHTSSEKSLHEFTNLSQSSNAFYTYHASAPRGDHDEWGGYTEERKSWNTPRFRDVPSTMRNHEGLVTLQGTINAVNAEIARNASVLITPIFSAWSDLLRVLMGVELQRDETNGNMTHFCCGCSTREQRYGTGNLWVFLGSGLAPRVRKRVRAAIQGANVEGCQRY